MDKGVARHKTAQIARWFKRKNADKIEDFEFLKSFIVSRGTQFLSLSKYKNVKRDEKW